MQVSVTDRPDSHRRPTWRRAVNFLHEALRPELETIFPTARLAPVMRAELDRIAPDAVFAYHWDSLAALVDVDQPKVGVVSDPWHLPSLRRWRATVPSPSREYVAWTATVLPDARHAPGMMVSLLNGCAVSGCFQKQKLLGCVRMAPAIAFTFRPRLPTRSRAAHCQSTFRSARGVRGFFWGQAICKRRRPAPDCGYSPPTFFRGSIQHLVETV